MHHLITYSQVLISNVDGKDFTMANKKKNEVEKRMTRRTTKIAIIGIALIVGQLAVSTFPHQRHKMQ